MAFEAQALTAVIHEIVMAGNALFFAMRLVVKGHRQLWLMLYCLPGSMTVTGQIDHRQYRRG